MSHTPSLVTPRGTAADSTGGSAALETSRSASAVSSPGSYSRWRNARATTDASDSALPSRLHGVDGTTPPAAPLPVAVAAVGGIAVSAPSMARAAEVSLSSLPAVVVPPSPAARQSDGEARSPLDAQDISRTSDTRPSPSVGERSYRYGMPASSLPSLGDVSLRERRRSAKAAASDAVGVSPAVPGTEDDSLRWSPTSPPPIMEKAGQTRDSEVDASPSAAAADRPHRKASPSARAALKDSTSTAAAIAAAVPRIAQAQASATEAYAVSWSRELQDSTADEAELRRCYQQLEKELVESKRALATADAKHARVVEALTRELEQERAARAKAEQDRDELLAEAVSGSPSMSPRGRGQQPYDADNNEASSTSGDVRALSPGNNNNAPGNNNRYVSDVFYDKLKEREERARARVRREFVRNAQESLFAEQRKVAEAEKQTAAALKRLEKAGEDLSAVQEALQEANAVLEAKDVQLHERAIHVQELEAHIRLLERQLAAAEDALRQAAQASAKQLEESQSLAAQRLAELEAQRQFAHQLQEKLGLTTRDLFDRENDQDGVLRTVHELQARCRQLEENFAAEVREATALLEQRKQRAEDEARLLAGRNDELKSRCSAMETELAELRARREYDSAEVTQLRVRHEKDLSECHVEIRSLQMQVERLTEAAQRRSYESASAQEIERQQQAALVHHYAAEARAVQEELDRVKAQMHRENDKHLSIVLDLSQQITALKQANTRLEHTVNVHEHESSDATRLLARARQELTQVREERRRLSASLVDLREDSRASSAVHNQGALLRRIAELENVRKDLTEKLYLANRTAQQWAHAIHDATARGVDPGDGVRAVADRPRQHKHRRGSLSSVSVPATDSFLGMSDDDERDGARHPLQLQPPETSGQANAVPALRELLESVVLQLHLVTGDGATHQRGASVHENLPTAPPTLRERRLRGSIQPDEREALDRVLVSCMAALECGQLKRTTSPFYSLSPAGAAFADRVAAHGNGAGTSPPASPRLCALGATTPLQSFNPVGGAFADAGSARESVSVRSAHSSVPQGYLPPRFYEGPVLRHGGEGDDATHRAAPWSADHAPQVPLARPRRSFQRSPSTVTEGNEGVVARLQHVSEGLPEPAPHRMPRPAHVDTVTTSTNGTAARESTRAQRHPGAAELSPDRDELESEPCWEEDAEDAELVDRFTEGPRRATRSGAPRAYESAAAPPEVAASVQQPTKGTHAASAPPSRPQRSGEPRSGAAAAPVPPTGTVSSPTRRLVTSLLGTTGNAAVYSASGSPTMPETRGETTVDGTEEGILQCSPIAPAAASGGFLASSRGSSAASSTAAAAAIAPGAGGHDESSHLFGNVRYAAPAQTRPVLVIDVHQSTPPPLRRRQCQV